MTNPRNTPAPVVAPKRVNLHPSLNRRDLFAIGGVWAVFSGGFRRFVASMAHAGLLLGAKPSKISETFPGDGRGENRPAAISQ
jgi:hypothetical protein